VVLKKLSYGEYNFIEFYRFHVNVCVSPTIITEITPSVPIQSIARIRLFLLGFLQRRHGRMEVFDL
jgi:hypothetical protein